MNDLVTQEQVRRPPLVAGARPMAIVPTTMEEAYRFANAVVEAGMAPTDKETVGKAMVAIMRGLEVGLTPFQALDKIAVINGRTTIWGDAAIGLVRGSGLCEYVKEWIDGEGDKRVAWCETRRKGEPFVVSRSFSVDDAKKAGLWGRVGPWKQYEARMLQMRARGFLLRDVYADVLGGLYIREEIEDEVEARAPRAPAPAVPESAKAIAPPVDRPAQEEGAAKPQAAPSDAPAQRKPPKPPAEPSKPAPDAPDDKPIDFAEHKANFEFDIAGASTMDEIDDLDASYRLNIPHKMTKPQYLELQAIYERRAGEIAG